MKQRKQEASVFKSPGCKGPSKEKQCTVNTEWVVMGTDRSGGDRSSRCWSGHGNRCRDSINCSAAMPMTSQEVRRSEQALDLGPLHLALGLAHPAAGVGAGRAAAGGRGSGKPWFREGRAPSIGGGWITPHANLGASQQMFTSLRTAAGSIQTWAATYHLMQAITGRSWLRGPPPRE